MWWTSLGVFFKCRRWWWASSLIYISLFSFFLSIKNDDELGGLSSFLGFFLRCRKWRRASQLVVVFFFSSNAKDDNELGGSWLVVISWFFSQVSACRCPLIFSLKCKRWWRADSLPTCHQALDFFPQVQKTSTSQDLGFLLSFAIFV